MTSTTKLPLSAWHLPACKEAFLHLGATLPSTPSKYFTRSSSPGSVCEVSRIRPSVPGPEADTALIQAPPSSAENAPTLKNCNREFPCFVSPSKNFPPWVHFISSTHRITSSCVPARWCPTPSASGRTGPPRLTAWLSCCTAEQKRQE